VDKKYVEIIYDLAMESFENDEIPVGAVVVKDDSVIGVGINSREKLHSVIGHAEINAIEEACKFIGDWRLDGCEMYVTLMPCMMCSGAILESRIKKVYYLCQRTNVRFDSGVVVPMEKIDDVDFEEKYLKMLQLFFENKRN
jgi:tRNA(adenine34) deaminase